MEKSSHISFWTGMVLFLILLWYLLLTPTGALKRTILLDHPKEAILSKIEKVSLESMGTVYHFNPELHDEDGKILYYGCSKGDFIFKCSPIKN